MKTLLKNLLIILVVLFFSQCDRLNNGTLKGIVPPKAEKQPKELVAHGDTRIDNYYWMRLSDEQKSALTQDEQTKKVLAYLDAENEYMGNVLGHTKEFQNQLFEEIKGRIKKDDANVPYLKNGYWYYTRYEQDQEYPIYCRKKGNLDADELIMLNVNELAKGHEFYSLSNVTVSPDNRILAFGVDTLSRRVYTIKFKNLENGDLLTDRLENTQGDAAWASDNSTIFYTSKNEVTLLSEKIQRHKLGSPSSDDVVVYHERDPSFYIGVYRSKSDQYIIISNSSTLVSDYHILRSDDPNGSFKQFMPREKNMLYSINPIGDKFYITTNWEAENFRLMETSAENTTKNHWKEVIPHRPDVLLEDIEVFNDFLVVSERKLGQLNFRIINRKNGEEHYIDFDEPAYLAYFDTNPDCSSELLRFGYTSLKTPFSTFDYNMNTKEKELKKRQEVVGGHDPEDYTTERLYAKSRDGVDIPISIVYKNGFKKDGTQPLLLYGYGSYGATIDPSFSSERLSLLDRGFAFAIAHIRGGQMLGRHWYEDGKLMKKKNTFYDFIDCGKFLIKEKYSSSDHIYALGGSAGGLLMGAVLNMEPLLFNGVIAAVPFVDVVTTMSDPTIPLTTNEYDEWGNPAEKTYYDYMKSYSPYDNLEAKKYTNVLVTTGLFDSQVQYWEPAKWVAKLRDYKTDNNSLFLHTNMDAGHGGASGRFERYKVVALEYAFMFDLEGIGN